MALGKQIRRYRSALGLTLEQLEARTGVGVGTIAALEGRDSERSKYASRLAAGLGLTLEQLLDESADAGSGSGSLVLDSPHQPSTDDDDLRIPRFDTGGAMGAGVELRDQPGVIQSLRVSRGMAAQERAPLHGGQQALRGDGFRRQHAPHVQSGRSAAGGPGRGKGRYRRRVLLPRRQRGFIKRLQHTSARGLLIRAKSENPKYDAWDITEGMDLQIFGRVLKVWRSDDF